MKFLERGRALFPPSVLGAAGTAGRGAWAEAAPRGCRGWRLGLVPSRGEAGHRHMPVPTSPRELPHRSPGCKQRAGRVERGCGPSPGPGGTLVPRPGDCLPGGGSLGPWERVGKLLGSWGQHQGCGEEAGGPQSPQAPLPECLGSLEWPPRRVEPQYFSTGFTRLQPPRGFPLIRNWSEKRLDSLDPARGLLLGPGGAGGPQSSGRRRGWLAAAGTLTLPVMRTAGAVCTALSTHWPCAGSLEPRWVSPGRGPRRPLSLPLS